MTIGPHKGKTVQQAKDIIRAEMIEAGQADSYWEPTETVMSRSGDKCVVAETEQWYLAYGTDPWRLYI